MAVQELYDIDFFEWTQRNAELLRRGCLESADISNIAEELADLGKNNQREVLSFLTRLLMHLLKWQFQPAQRSSSWLVSIGDSRQQLKRIYAQSPSLRRFAEASVKDVYGDALDLAGAETGMPLKTFPQNCPYSFDQLMEPGFLPES